ncbi:MAG: AAA family ATPase [Acetobacteraceae bacterium]|nr:AAA family ATPase [Acetobacteraceae bacterium]
MKMHPMPSEIYGRRISACPAVSHQIPKMASYRLDRLTAGEPPPRQFTLSPLFPLGTVGVLYGPGGVGKSLVAMSLCMAVAQRAAFPGGGLSFAAGPLGGNVPQEGAGAAVFVTLEDDGAEIHRRRVSLDPRGECAGVPAYVLPVVDLPAFDPTLVGQQGRAIALTDLAKSGLDSLLDDVEADACQPVRLLVLDPAGDFLASNENDSEGVKLLMRTLRQVAARRGCTIILLGHVPKSNDGAMPTMRGSGAWIANARAAYALWPPAEDEARKLAQKVGGTPDGLVWGCLAKANHGGAPVGRRRLFRRDAATGRLLDVTSTLDPRAGLDEGALLDALVAACSEAAVVGFPFAHHRTGGLYDQREDLPAQLAGLSKAALADLGQRALDGGLLVKARNGSTGAPKFLDVPIGPLAKGQFVPPASGSRREAVARHREGGSK